MKPSNIVISAVKKSLLTNQMRQVAFTENANGDYVPSPVAVSVLRYGKGREPFAYLEQMPHNDDAVIRCTIDRQNNRIYELFRFVDGLLFKVPFYKADEVIEMVLRENPDIADWLDDEDGFGYFPEWEKFQITTMPSRRDIMMQEIRSIGNSYSRMTISTAVDAAQQVLEAVRKRYGVKSSGQTELEQWMHNAVSVAIPDGSSTLGVPKSTTTAAL